MPNMYATGTGMARGLPAVLKASAAETTSTVGASVPTGSYAGNLYVEVNVTAASGTTPTLLVNIQGSNDGTNWFTLGTVGSNGYAVGSVNSAPANFTAAAGPVRAFFPMTQYVRYSSTVGGSAGQSFTYSVKATLDS